MEEEILKFATTFEYRGITLNIYDDDYGQSLFTILPWNNEPISFGTYNANYKEDCEYLIDEHLDVITRDFGEKHFGACLRWFNNAGYRDIELTYRMRVLKVFLVAVPEEVNIEKLIEEAKQILDKVI